MPCMAGISIIYCHVHVMKRCAPRQVTSVMDFGATFIIQAFSKELIKDKHSSGKPRSERVPEYRYFGILRKSPGIASNMREKIGSQQVIWTLRPWKPNWPALIRMLMQSSNPRRSGRCDFRLWQIFVFFNLYRYD